MTVRSCGCWIILLVTAAAPCLATGETLSDEARRLVESADDADAAGRIEEALEVFERSMAYRRLRNAVYDMAVCQVLLGHRDHRLDSRFLMPAGVCEFSYQDGLRREEVERTARLPQNDINGKIRSLLNGSEGGYQSFLNRFDSLRGSVALSSNKLANAAGNCNEGRGPATAGRLSISSSSMVLQGWHAEQQQNPHSVYAVVLE